MKKLTGHYTKPSRKDILLGSEWPTPKNFGYCSLIIEDYCVINHVRPNHIGLDLSDEYEIIKDKETISEYLTWYRNGFLKEVGICIFEKNQLDELIEIASNTKERKKLYEKSYRELLAISSSTGKLLK